MRFCGILARAVPAVLALSAVLLVGGSDGAVLASRTMTLYDDHTSLEFSLQVEPQAPDPGRFDLRVPGFGVYEATAGPDMKVVSPTSVIVKYQGEAVLRPFVTLEGLQGTVIAPSKRSIELQAQVDPMHHTGQAQLTDGSARYHLVAAHANDRGGLVSTLRAFESAYRTEDWATAYTLMNSDVRAAYTSAAFAGYMSGQMARQGSIQGLVRLATGDIVSDDSGATYVPVTYAVTVRSTAGMLTTQQYIFYFIRQRDGWRLWGSKPT